MINLLRKKFIKNYSDIDNEDVRVGHGKLAAIFGIITNSILVAGKLSIAFYLASLNNWIFSSAIVADSINNLGDIASSVVTLIGFSMSKKPADEKHPFGHQRVEYIAGLVVSVIVIVTAAELFTSSINKIVSNQVVNYEIATLIVIGISIVLKLYQAYFNYKLGKLINSPSLKATSLDSISDAVVSTVLLVGFLVSYYVSYPYLDGYLGIVVSLFIIASGIKMIKETSDPLIGSSTDTKYNEIIDDILKNKDEIIGYHDLIVHSYGPTKIFISLHVEIDENISLVKAHEIVDSIEKEIKDKIHCDATIHVDPISKESKIIKDKNMINTYLLSIDSRISIHDFREKENQVEFDILIPFDDNLTKEEIEKKLKEEFPLLSFNINVDHPYVC